VEELFLSFVECTWQTEVHTAEPLVTEFTSIEVEIIIEKLKSYKSPGTD
jgi:hypothetical protein